MPAHPSPDKEPQQATLRSMNIDLPLLLPEVADARDACIERLKELITARRGVLRTHVQADTGATGLCIHFDPTQVTGEEVRRLARAAGADVQARVGHSLIRLRALRAEDAGARVEEALLEVPGVLAASVNLAAQSLRVEFDRTKTNAEAIERATRELGFGLEKEPQAGEPSENWYERNRELAWSLIAGAQLFVAFIWEKSSGESGSLILRLLYLSSYAFGGFDLVRHTLASIRRRQFTFDIDLLMLLAAIGAALLGAWAEGAFLLFLFSLAHSLEHYALGRARASIRGLAELAPPLATVFRGANATKQVPVAEVRVGDLVLVAPGARIPVDGTVKVGESSVNQAPITGESVPVEKFPGQEVFAGTINGEGALSVLTTRAAGDRTLDRVMKMVEEAQTAKAPTQLFTERFERIFVPTVLIVDVVLMVGAPLLGWLSWQVSFYRAMALLVAASPCALALGTPATVLAGIARAARRGVLIKGGVHLETLGTVRAFAFDKTGTLTVGRPDVTDVMPAPGVSRSELLRVAAAVERQSQHPLAQAVVRKAQEEGVAALAVDAVESVTGRGIRARVDAQRVQIGNERLFTEGGIELDEPVRAALKQLQDSGRSVMLVHRENGWLGVLGLADRPRPEVARILARVRALGVKTLVMLTGDHRAVGEAIGREVGVDAVRAELMPEDKVSALNSLLKEHRVVAMVGDGVNDAPALAQASVGIAMGGAGTAAALETADVALMADDLARLPFAIGLSRKARAIIRQNLLISMLVIAVLLLTTTLGVFGIGPAVFVHEGSTLLVIANALRLLRYE